jgi:RNA polymerase-binding protein DksA
LADRDLKHFEQLLRARRREVLAELAELEEVYLGKNQRETSGDVSGYSTHPADMGSDEAMRDVAFSRGQADGEVLEEIDEALDRIKGGEYGRCESCGVDIPDARLEVLPNARLCIMCQENLEKTGGGGPR